MRLPIKISIAIVSLLGLAFLFQNCAAAPPPDLNQANQSSVAPGGVNPPGVITTPTPIPPVTQTYSWQAGAFGLCNGSVQTRAVTCVDGTGAIVADANCNAGIRPADTAVCSLPYSCVATLRTLSFFGGTIKNCTYACTGPSVYNAKATTASTCNANPMLVAGTEVGWVTDSNIKIARPFTRCTTTIAMRTVSSSEMKGESTCE